MPGVSDPEMEQLVNEKVDTFWKGIEGGVNKRGQIIVTFSEKRRGSRYTWAKRMSHVSSGVSHSLPHPNATTHLGLRGNQRRTATAKERSRPSSIQHDRSCDAHKDHTHHVHLYR